jgi:hypothetical protein
MGLREVAGEMARNTSGLWRGVADALDPDGRPTRTPTAAPEVVTPPATGEQPTIDLVTEPSVVVEPAHSGTGDGASAVVPLDTWTRILEQVGNVHEAGQQLAEARERAARAEVENRFLKEQLADLKSQRRPTRRTAKPAVPAPAAPNAGPAPETRVTRVRRVASGWLSP